MRTWHTILSLLEKLKNKHDQQIAEIKLLHAKEVIQDYQAKISSQNL